ncbi:phage gp6-like head-tail connector protein [Candidatus Saccharibacteria bacterium]|nr:phage gp6-like head-tail connector protein [Candidatus Saccharibacteria bacterium]
MSQYLEITKSLSCIEVVGTEPISLADAKLYLRVDTDDDDTLITAMISAARAAVEGKTHRVIRQSIWEWTTGEIIAYTQVPLTPCSNCTVQVDGENVSPDLYTFTSGGIAAPLFASVVPSIDFPKGKTVFTLTCGYTNGEVPEDITRWMFMRLGDFYNQRESFAVGNNFHEFDRSFVDALLDPYLIPSC